ncbi:uncharacterized protein LOC124483921 isoform X2 [Hypomesus transpacificus]|uniref:uncharacterized protein LOC124483921 isoform X2 n=1 Tax=Hypomesus transpacificus TaxID=137520 RepID=UPI001F072C1E|nr:uncharacterized protein LOC124483921 isoform X2 [Hypomesus transpacificus]
MDILMFVNDQIKGFIIKKDFPEPPVDAEPGDVIILRNDRMLREPTYHAGVCCADGEVIHLSDSSGGVMKSKPGNVCRQNINGFTQGKSYRLLQKEHPLPASFETKVKQAMNSDQCHDKTKHNCIDFSLDLIEFKSETLTNSSSAKLQGSTPEDHKEGLPSHQRHPSTTKENSGGCTEDMIPLVSPPPKKVEEPPQDKESIEQKL